MYPFHRFECNQINDTPLPTYKITKLKVIDHAELMEMKYFNIDV